ncbi:MAG: PilZ domain-containing protein [Acidobacteria bacterium]|nr:MAG: PilZ domain-containing protein [Acidobacteriota bacterium]REK02326.1 MAG: PilZ domain-containing protein [Acidobacteriota bacterium]REK13871.1 MAG: PilZ domain-containing protein [Acidobacteriota bacterium]REK41866.1 MAG: PilZ domain-containing protein [Acidobacteriota bacterium]
MSTTDTAKPASQEARRIQRIAITLPLKVEGKDSRAQGWEEVTRLKDISAFGAGFTLKRPVKRGRLLLLTLPMPRKMRCFDYLDPQYRIWAIVRRCVRLEAGNGDTYLVGVAFIGRVPPKSYLEDPSVIYEVVDRGDKGLWRIERAEPDPDEDHLPKEDRRHYRYDMPINLSVEVVDEEGRLIKREETVTENISLSGAAVFSSIDIEVGSFIKISCPQFNTSIKAVVRGKRIGPDGIPRLHVEFIDSYFPLEGIES